MGACNLILHIQVSWQLSKQGIRWPVSHGRSAGLDADPSSTRFFKLSAGKLQGMYILADNLQTVVIHWAIFLPFTCYILASSSTMPSTHNVGPPPGGGGESSALLKQLGYCPFCCPSLKRYLYNWRLKSSKFDNGSYLKRISRGI